MIRHKGRWIALGLLVLMLLVAAAHVLGYGIRSAHTRAEEELMRLMLENWSTLSPVTTEMPSPQPTRTMAMAGASVQDTVVVRAQFDAALRQNPDTVGGLVAGSDIRSYVVQRDNAWYLTHAFSGEVNRAGAIFLDTNCSISKPSRNFILHGHNMKDGTVFAKLLDFSKEYYLNVFPVIRFCTLEADGYYAVFSVFSFSVRSSSADYFPVQQPGFRSETEFLQYVAEAKTRSQIAIPVEVRGGDHLLTLLTCTHVSDKDERFAVMARKLREDETPEAFRNLFPGAIRELYYKIGSSYMKGPDVAEIQEALITLGYLQDNSDGTYGQSTADAVARFQAEHGLKADGVVGAQTRALLLAVDMTETMNAR